MTGCTAPLILDLAVGKQRFLRMQVVSEGNEGRSPGAATEAAGNSHLQRFPEVPEPWQLE